MVPTSTRRFLRYFDVRDYGAVRNGSTNDAAAIQAAINAAIAAGGGIVYLPRGAYAVATALTINTRGVALLGDGSGNIHTVGGATNGAVSYLTWTGSAGADMLSLIPTEGASATALAGNHVEGLGFFGNGTAARGLVIKSLQHARIQAYFRGFTGSACYIGCVDTLGDALSSQHLDIDIQFRQIDASSGAGLEVAGATTNGNFSQNLVRQVHGLYYNSTGIICGSSDNNLWLKTRLFRAAGGSGTGILLKAGSASEHAARAQRFIDLTPGAGGMELQGTGVAAYPPDKIKVFSYDKENGAPDPVIGTGAELWWERDDRPIGSGTWMVASGDRTTTSGSYADVGGGLSFPVRNGGQYLIVLSGHYTTTDTTNGLSIAFNHPGGACQGLVEIASGGPTTFTNEHLTAVNTATGTSTTDASGTPRFWRATFRYAATADGTWALRFKRNGAGSGTIAIKGGSGGQVYQSWV